MTEEGKKAGYTNKKIGERKAKVQVLKQEILQMQIELDSKKKANMTIFENKEKMENCVVNMQEKTEYYESLHKELTLVSHNFSRIKKNEITDYEGAQNNGQHLADKSDD